jgi:hypothetical protein
MDRLERIVSYIEWFECNEANESQQKTKRALADALIEDIWNEPLVGELLGARPKRGSEHEYRILFDGYQRAVRERDTLLPFRVTFPVRLVVDTDGCGPRYSAHSTPVRWYGLAKDKRQAVRRARRMLANCDADPDSGIRAQVKQMTPTCRSCYSSSYGENGSIYTSN